MKCYECGGNYVERHDKYEYSDHYVGTITVEGVKYYSCDTCDDILFSIEMTEAIERERDRRISEFIANSPVKDFVSSSEAATILGVSRQAFNKNRRIKRGFIYQTTLSGSPVYLEKSVLLFKDTGDGRFPLDSFQSVKGPKELAYSKYVRCVQRNVTYHHFPL
jgi:hypothetical protein